MKTENLLLAGLAAFAAVQLIPQVKAKAEDAIPGIGGSTTVDLKGLIGNLSLGSSEGGGGGISADAIIAAVKSALPGDGGIVDTLPTFPGWQALFSGLIPEIPNITIPSIPDLIPKIPNPFTTPTPSPATGGSATPGGWELFNDLPEWLQTAAATGALGVGAYSAAKLTPTIVTGANVALRASGSALGRGAAVASPVLGPLAALLSIFTIATDARESLPIGQGGFKLAFQKMLGVGREPIWNQGPPDANVWAGNYHLPETANLNPVNYLADAEAASGNPESPTVVTVPHSAPVMVITQPQQPHQPTTAAGLSVRQQEADAEWF